MSDDFAGSAYSSLIKEQLEQERARKQSLEQRGLAVVTSSGTLVTLLFAVGALATEAKGLQLPQDSRVLMILALLFFAGAGILGILTNRPDIYLEVETEWLRKTLNPIAWGYKDVPLGMRRSAEARVRSIESFRERNPKKVKLLVGAIACEVIAVAFVAVGVVLLLL